MTVGRFAAGLRAWRFGHAQAALSSLGNLVRSPLGTFLTVAVIGVALALPAAAFMLVSNLLDVSAHFSTDAQISVFLDPQLGDVRGEELAREFAGMENVAGTRMISKAEALDEFRASSQTGYSLEGLGNGNPLPVVVVINPHDPGETAMDRLVSRLRAVPGVDFIQDDRDWLERLDAFSELSHRLLSLVSAVLSVGIVLVVGNTVRLSIESRRAEVEVARLFGASDAFVRRPFLYHGLYYGLGGGMLAWLLLATGGLVLAPALERLRVLYPGWGSFDGVALDVLVVLLAAGGLLGLAGAWIWVGWHLRRVEPR